MTRTTRVRRGGIAGPLVFVVAVVGLSLAVVAWRQRRSVAVAHGDVATTKRFAGAATVVELPSRFPPARLAARIPVAILHDAASDGYYDGPSAMDSVVGRWRAALEAMGASVRVLSPREALGATDVRAFVVPASPCLGADARRALEAATRRGQGLVVTWLTGVRDGGCRSVGYGFLAAMSGAARLDTMSSTARGSYVTFAGGGPLMADIPPGARMELLVGNHVALRTPTREAYFSDFMLNPTSAGAPLLDGAVARTTVGGARVVYWGFDLLRVVRHPWSLAIADHLARNSVAWAAGAPLTTVEPWPGGRTAAVVIAQDVEDEFANGRHALDSLRAAGVPGTYFLVSKLALQHADLARDMARQGEVGTHTPRHRLLGGEPADVQRDALRVTQEDLASLVGRPVAGLRPPEEQFDVETMKQWVRAGGRYIFAANNARTASPEIIDVGGTPLVLLGRVINDDFISVRRAGKTDPAALAREYLTALDKVRALGGLYILSYHSQMMSRPELVPALARVARSVAADSSLWVATAGQVADWWLARSRLETTTERRGAGVRVTVRNAGPTTVAGAVLRVETGAPIERVDGGTLRGPSAGAGGAQIALPPLAAGSTTSVTVQERGGGSDAR